MARGRPPKHEFAKRNAVLSTRISDDLKAALLEEAKANRRALSQEIENRLRKSFERQGLLDEVLKLAYGPKLAGILLGCAAVAQSTGRLCWLLSGQEQPGVDAIDNWPTDPFCFDQAVKSILALLDGPPFRPAGDPDIFRSGRRVSEQPASESLMRTGQRQAEILLTAVTDGAWGKQFPEEHRNVGAEKLAARIRDLINNAVAHIGPPQG